MHVMLKKKKKVSIPKVQMQMQKKSGCILVKNICADVGSAGICLLPK